MEQLVDVVQRLRERFGDRALVTAAVLLGAGLLAIVVPALLGATDDRSAPADADTTVSQLFDAPTTTTTSTPLFVVHVLGAVRSPGLYRLPRGSRIADALEVAGGVGEDIDMERVNLAAPLADGQRVYIPRVGQPTAADPSNASGPTAAGDAGGGQLAGSPIDLNVAEAQQLETLPGVGPSTAAAILDHRRTVGRFSSVDELLDVRGIGEAKLDAIRDLVTVG